MIVSLFRNLMFLLPLLINQMRHCGPVGREIVVKLDFITFLTIFIINFFNHDEDFIMSLWRRIVWIIIMTFL